MTEAMNEVMNEASIPRNRLGRLRQYVESFCSLYSRVARQFNVDRSYVSRVVRGERHSEEIERALANELARITGEAEQAGDK